MQSLKPACVLDLGLLLDTTANGMLMGQRCSIEGITPDWVPTPHVEYLQQTQGAAPP